jgi:hypothetical protein
MCTKCSLVSPLLSVANKSSHNYAGALLVSKAIYDSICWHMMSSDRTTWINVVDSQRKPQISSVVVVLLSWLTARPSSVLYPARQQEKHKQCFLHCRIRKRERDRKQRPKMHCLKSLLDVEM